MSATLLHHLIHEAAARSPEAIALKAPVATPAVTLDYARLAATTDNFAATLLALGLSRGGRVAIWLDKRFENIIACFGTAAAGGVFVPINPVLKPEQVGHILQDSGALVLVTNPERLPGLRDTLPNCPAIKHLIVTGKLPEHAPITLHPWPEESPSGHPAPHRVIDTDISAIFYTSGSTGRPKGVVLSHRNMLIGAQSVAQYLENRTDDVLLAALPLSFDAGFSQLSTAFHASATVVLLNYIMPRDVINNVVRHRVTGLTAVPPLWIQLARLEWPDEARKSLRYFANTGGRMPGDTLARLRGQLPHSKPYLMYGLTEAFRATCLMPDDVDQRPDSIGRAIPNAEVLILREDGSECAPDEPGELVQRGALVSQGYWNDPQKTRERFKPLPDGVGGRTAALTLPEIAVYSGDTVKKDRDGFLYFIGRRDDMIKTSGYRVSPTEVEEILYTTGLIGECAVFGAAHDELGQQIVAIVTAPANSSTDGKLLIGHLLNACRERMPAYMVPARVLLKPGILPRNPNGKIDRNALKTALGTEL